MDKTLSGKFVLGSCCFVVIRESVLESWLDKQERLEKFFGRDQSTQELGLCTVKIHYRCINYAGWDSAGQNLLYWSHVGKKV